MRADDANNTGFVGGLAALIVGAASTIDGVINVAGGSHLAFVDGTFVGTGGSGAAVASFPSTPSSLGAVGRDEVFVSNFLDALIDEVRIARTSRGFQLVLADAASAATRSPSSARQSVEHTASHVGRARAARERQT